MHALIERLHPTGFTRRDWRRNIVSLRRSEDLFDDLADDADARAHLQAVETDRRPPDYAGAPVLHRPFQEGAYLARVAEAIDFPFRHPGASRFSDGSFGVWYGANSVLTSAYETAYHWLESLVEGVLDRPEETHYVERRVFRVSCKAPLLDLRPQLGAYRKLVDPVDRSFCQRLGSELRGAGYPGLVNRSVRAPHPGATSVAVFEPGVLDDPRDECFLTYSVEPGSRRVRVERAPGRTWRVLPV